MRTKSTIEPPRLPPSRAQFSRLQLFLFWLVRVDPDILATCPRIDHYQQISKAVLLLAIAGIALFAWGGFFAQFWPFYIALPLTLVVIVWIVMIDQIMGASRWALRGVLATPGKAFMLGISAAFVFRLLLGGVTSSATSYSATMLMNRATIAAQLQKDRDAENAAKRIEGEAEKTRLRRSMLGSRDDEVKQLSDAIKAIDDQLDADRRTREAAGQQIAATTIEADCQEHGGPGCRRGKGTQYRKALTLRDKAAGDLRLAETEIPALEDRRAALERKRDAVLGDLHAHEGAYLKAAKAIDLRVAREAVPPRNDPAMSYIALQEVFHSPAGRAARFYEHLMLGLLLMMEISYVVSSEYFSHASIHEARLIARTKTLAAQAASQYRNTAGALFQPDNAGGRLPEHGSFRVVPRFGPAE
jgi:hypothetical protein